MRVNSTKLFMKEGLHYAYRTSKTVTGLNKLKTKSNNLSECRRDDSFLAKKNAHISDNSKNSKLGCFGERVCIRVG